MKRIVATLVVLCLACIASYGQKKYEMVVVKTDGTETVFNVEDVVKTYFREREDDSQPVVVNPSGGITGRWMCVMSEGIDEGEEYEEDFEDEEWVWVFGADGTYNSYYEGVLETNESAKYTVSGNEIKITPLKGGSTQTWTYELSGNTLIITIGKKGTAVYTKMTLQRISAA